MRTLCFLAVCLSSLVISTWQLNLDFDSQKEQLGLAPKEAKSLLRVRRGWGSFRKKINPFEQREEAQEDAQARARAAAAAERAREAQYLEDRKNRECPGLCLTGWSEFANCTYPCGGGGMATRTRRVKTQGELPGLCQNWVAQGRCTGDTVETVPCKRFCHNSGILNPTGCTCPAGWQDTCCNTRVTCPDPGKPENGLTTPSGAGLHFATTVQFSCNQGYTLQGPTSSTCAGAGTWTNSIPTCQIISCGDPGTPSNSDLEVLSGSGFVYGMTVRVSCHHGYSLRGDSVRRCEADGKWAGIAPTCNQIVCANDPKPANGQVVYPSGRTLDAEAQYSCVAGYVLQGTPIRKCMSNGQWAGQVPSCTQILCNNLVAPTFGTVVHTGSNGGKTPYGGSAAFSCQTGYALHGAQSLTCEGPAVQGKWSGRPPTCEAISCGDPGSPTNGARTGGVFTFGASISFKCSAGYFLEGSATAQCKAEGQWSSQKPECKACSVDQYKEGTNEKTSCDACPMHSTTRGATGVTSKVNCLCSEGYKGGPGGPCVQITCAALPTPANSIKKTCQNTYNGRCEFECKPGNIVSSGDLVRSCDANGWSGRDLVCTACPLNTYKSGISQCTSCPDNSGTLGLGNEKSGCVCNRGWGGPPGGPCTDVNECLQNNGNCSQTCINEIGRYRCECTDAGWVKDDDNPTQCNPKNQCPVMQVPANGGLICHSHKQTNTERCQVKCNKGYEHIARPNAFEECGPSTNWRWNHEIQGRPILDCVVSWFEEIIIEMDVFYFTDQCTSLTNMQELQIAREFVQFLNSNGVCQVGGKKVCDVGDVDIECAVASRKRSARQKLIIKFSLKSMVVPHIELGEQCDANCREDYTELTKNKMQVASQNTQNAIQATIVHPTGSTGELPSISLGGIRLTPLEVKPSQLHSVCAKGMVRNNSTCVACPSGSYAVRLSDHCTLCPIGSFQPLDGQTICLPCRTASFQGSKSC